MRLLRYRRVGATLPGALDDHGVVRDLSAVIADLTADNLSDAALEQIADLDRSLLPAVPAPIALAAPVVGTRNFVAVGLNYRDHVTEARADIPSEPVLFNKAPSSISGPCDDIVLPAGARRLDWEIELAVVIGTRAYQIEQDRALDHVAGYCICNDVSERAWQIEGTGQWMKGKSAPTFGPLGPWLVTRDEVPDPQNLTMSLSLNDLRVQHATTRDMIFPVAALIAYISRFCALEPGDVITTGTPAGVGMARDRYLRIGDRLRLEIEGLGRQQLVVA